MQWLNEPPHWAQTEQNLTLTTAPHTDFWRITHYGFIRLFKRPLKGKAG